MPKQSSEEIAKAISAAKQKHGGWRWIVPAVVVLLVLGGWLWLGRTQSATGVTYTTEAVTQGTLTVTVTATGTVQPTTEVEVSSELSGTLATVEVDYNDEVEIGQVLARLDDTKFKAQVANATASLAAAKAQLVQAEASAREAEAIYEAQKELDRRGVVTHTDFVTYTANHERAQAAVDAAKAALTLAEANLELEQADLDKSVIRSPIKGVVLDRAYSAGQIVAASLSAPTLFTLAEDLTRMELQVDIDEADIGQVATGNTATFTVDAYSGQSFPATITQVRYAPEETDDVVTYKAVLAVNNDTKLLRPGMTATATITVAKVDDAVQVPNAALRYAPPQVTEDTSSGAGGLVGLIMPGRPGNGSTAKASAKTVWVLKDGVPTEIEVTPGESDGKHTIITAGDLAVGDLVITDQREAQ
ncbi:efflux RND transporter periplasmic adaptor subunit [Paenirhodobacter sp. CAU 1674]|uniref:efflux RND transporter periplasmic adaptor subunit n=1 Tax=Paenirhodobacter sp. CAU 1674 TaxID=3032596 RepID=UPI0023DB50E2|nr:efflux RND transporter periplasmic adaptor subunit [Paenirhodobacter sp. CAU 1674]MDF2142027.1 efflux RND transporter periplasmic adaptor subunit [Paenirhodobacter sp. CAU 1674]